MKKIILVCFLVMSFTFAFSATLIDEDFESFPPAGWSLNSVFKNTGAGVDGSVCAAFNASDDWAQLPDQNNPGKLSFWIASDVINPDFTFVVQKDTGSGWVAVKTIVGTQVTTTYAEHTVDIMENQDGVSIRFIMTANSNGKARIDDVYLNDYDEALPVTLSSFTAQYAFGSPILSWSTQSEVDNMGWNVYRSTVGNMGQSMILNVEGMIAGAGTTSEPTDYSYRDEHDIIFNVTYWYWLESISISGDAELFGPITLTIPYNDPNSNSTPIPIEYGLFQNYPNPFNPSTEISFMLTVDSRVELSIYDIEGRKVITLLDNEIVSGEQIHSIVWNGKDQAGKNVSSGIYFYKLSDGENIETRRMLLIK